MTSKTKKIIYLISGVSGGVIVGGGITAAILLTRDNSDDGGGGGSPTDKKEYYPYINEVREGTGKDQVYKPDVASKGVSFMHNSSSWYDTGFTWYELLNKAMIGHDIQLQEFQQRILT